MVEERWWCDTKDVYPKEAWPKRPEIALCKVEEFMSITQLQYAQMLSRTQKNKARDKNPTGFKKESDLHAIISAHCRAKGWIALHSRMDQPSANVGSPDYVILMNNGKVLMVEAKTRTGKLRTEQQAFHAWAKQLGHTVHVVRSENDFLDLIAT